MKMLLVEDDKITILGIKKILEKFLAPINIVVANNGQVALDILSSAKNDTDLPKFILLDLNMPVMDGLELLSIIRKDKILHMIPVVIHTTSSNDNDYIKCEAQGICGYYIKDVNYKVFMENIICIANYWNNQFKGNK
ncbi:response regulator [Nonlabens sp. MB-3u-79]|jgi:CheY-like chemotaxis protein|uniref:response regulator n=1 Tax=Nonlabens sp. MB-3u-79 TaxID=2058134 RepID=UPI000C30362C|nr:response regulator [Nonlabens sp. MB-3u-79]AUC80021.1 response regulator [Nonlabens sp. MB-3u-79]|tara:strand:- start:221 stop:631 length:411 start_codon:yes stop_codon:yes gene_type:complete